ncbi:MAG TPA: MBL fold metallo-hydrolase [Gemmatimonadales bacterium]|nr:MBL fold metallo-hydrolase [Gemmatimonadales bacterium]
MRHLGLALLATAILHPAPARAPARAPASAAARVTILYDAFGARDDLQRDWGFAALVETGGKRILFDTGNNADIFARNATALGVDLRSIDLVVISHRHGDHTAGLSYVLSVNPNVTVYAPAEGLGGVFGTRVPSTFYRREASLPAHSRYFDGQPPDQVVMGTHWPGAHIELVDSIREVAPGVSVIPTVSNRPGTLELRELSLAVRTPQGLVLVVGCSHPGIETIVAASARVAPHVHMIVGGLHLVTTPDSEIARVAAALHDRWHIDRIAPGHCTGEPAFLALRRTFDAAYVYAGLGTAIDVP